MIGGLFYGGYMSAGALDLYIEKGTDWLRYVTLLDANEEPIDITNYSFNAHLRQSVAATEFISFVIAKTDAANGQLSLSLANTVTSAITYNTGVYDVEAIDGVGIVSRILEGAVTLKDEVTRVVE